MATPQQKRVLLALESGRKLHDLLIEPGMPSKALLEEWRDNPEFDIAYLAAEATGRADREQKSGRPEPVTPPVLPAPRPVPAKPPKREKTPPALRVLRGPATVHGTADDQRRLELSSWLTAIIGDGDTYQTPPGRSEPLPDTLPVPSFLSQPTAAMPITSTLTTAEQQARVLDGLRAGKSAGDIRAMPGINSNKIALWRQDKAFAAQWDAAKADGKNQQRGAKKTPVTHAPTPTVAPEAAPVLSVATVPAAIAVAAVEVVPTWRTPEIMPRHLWLQRVEHNRMAELRDAMLRCLLDTEDVVPPEWVQEYNELRERLALAA